MTRQKRELMNKIEEIENFIRADEELGCGFAPAGFYDPLYEEIGALMEQLATLSHYDSVEAMLHDDRWMKSQLGKPDNREELPF